MDIVKVFGTNVRKYRTELAVSQEKFAEMCGLHRTYISDIERFQRSIIFPSLTQFLPVAVEMDHSVHNSDNEIKSIKHPLFTLR